MSRIDKQLLKHLLELSRLDVPQKDRPRLLKDLSAILDYFEQLKEVRVEGAEPMSGGTLLTTVMRQDEIDIELKKKESGETGRVIEAFPEKKGTFLKVPPVF